jgi:hypothetical protein
LGPALPADRCGRAEATPGRCTRQGWCIRFRCVGLARARQTGADMLARDGEHFRRHALALRKASLERLLPRPLDGILTAYTNKATSATFYSASPATSASKELSASAWIAPMAPANATTGSKSRTLRSGVQQSQGQTPSVTLFTQTRIVHAARILGAAENHDNDDGVQSVWIMSGRKAGLPGGGEPGGSSRQRKMEKRSLTTTARGR